jgi:polyferredoxin
MDKMGYPRGLVSYTTQHKLAGGSWTWKRPRLLGYGVALLVMLLLFAGVLFTRTPLRLDVMRDRGQLYQPVAGGLIENVFTLKIINMQRTEQTYTLQVDGLPSPRLIPDAPVSVPAGEIVEAVVRVQVDPDQLADFNTAFDFVLESAPAQGADLLRVSTPSRYFGPRPLAR